MQSIVELMRRRTLLGAAAAIALGAYLLIRSFGAVAAPQSESPPADVVSLDLLGEEEALAPAAEGQEILAEAEAVIVYVSGAVVAPDVYRLPVSARVKDLVVAAGGLNADADADQINLAAPLTDGQHIIVPRLGAASLALAEGSQAGQDGGLLDINTADPEALDALPGIGAAIAERIVAYREENGPFRAVEELQQVKGIGAALFEKIAPLVTVGP